MPAKRRPRRSVTESGAPMAASAASAWNTPSGKRLAVNFSVTHQPSSVMTGVENAMKNQLAAGLTEYVGSTMRAASCDRPESSGSMVPISRLAE